MNEDLDDRPPEADISSPSNFPADDNPHTVKTAFVYASMLRRLTLPDTLSNFIDDALITRLALSNPANLEKLSIRSCAILTETPLSSLISRCSRLTSLDVSNIPAVGSAFLKAVAASCERIASLHIAGTGVDDLGLIEVAMKRGKTLKKIMMSECGGVTDRALVVMARQCRKLVELDLSGCGEGVTGVGVAALLGLRSTGDAEQEGGLRFLRDLNLARCFSIAEPAPLLPTNPVPLHTLRSLNLGDISTITDGFLISVLAQTPKLRTLVLSRCAALTDDGISAVAQIGRSLHFLHMGHCDALTDEGVRRVVTACVKLRYLDLSSLRITDAALIDVSRSCTRLRRLSITKCRLLTDASLQTLHLLAPTLERVHLSYCPNLSSRVLRLLIESCYVLSYITLSGCMRVLESDTEGNDGDHGPVDASATLPASPRPLSALVRGLSRPAPAEYTEEQRRGFCALGVDGIAALRTEYGVDADVVGTDSPESGGLFGGEDVEAAGDRDVEEEDNEEVTGELAPAAEGPDGMADVTPQGVCGVSEAATSMPIEIPTPPAGSKAGPSRRGDGDGFEGGGWCSGSSFGSASTGTAFTAWRSWGGRENGNGVRGP